ncbi:MAG TPA: DUF2085 domain-containing protein [Ktedonobacterales bacterium]|nr:DUF2085 domain-containing protein [Ktedonobacterales bacterium]
MRMAATQAERGAGGPGRAGGPPWWLLAGLLAGYVLALVGLAVFPGATLIERLRALDGGICAQMPGHSFFPGGEQLPLCARNTGIYLGFATTFLYLAASRRLRVSRLPRLSVMIALGLAILLMAVDGFNSLFLDLGLPHLYQPANWLRLLTGLGAGTAMAAIIVPTASGLIWRADDPRSSFDSLGELALMLPLLTIGFFVVVSVAPIILYPVGILSSVGLVLALTLVNLVFALGLTNRIGRFTTWRQLFPVFSGVVVLAVVELMALFLLKSSVMNALMA